MAENRKTINRKPLSISEAAEDFFRSNKAKGLAEAICHEILSRQLY